MSNGKTTFLGWALLLSFTLLPQAWLQSAEPAWRPLLIPKALVAVGSWGDMFRWREAMHSQGILYDDTFVIANRSLVGMPESEDEYYGYSVIVLVNVEVRSLGPKRLEIIRRFVEQGGGLAVFGRSYDFAPDGYSGTALEDMLPVTYVDEHAFQRREAGLVLKPDPKSQWPWKVSFDAAPRAYYVQKLVPKENATVELRAGDEGILYTCSLGRGRVSACGLTIHGQAAAGDLAFWDWPDWPLVFGQAVDWAGANRLLQVAPRRKPVEVAIDIDTLEAPKLEPEPVSAEFVMSFTASPTPAAANVLFERLFIHGQTKLPVTAETIDALATFARPDWLDPLLKKSDAFNPDITLRKAALELLGATGNPKVGRKLIAAIEERDVAINAIDGLRRLGDASHVPLLRGLYDERVAQSSFRLLGMTGIDMSAAARQSAVAIHTASALYALGDRDGLRRMAELYREIRLLRRVHANAVKTTSSHLSEGAAATVRAIMGMRNNLIEWEAHLLAAAGPVPERQQAAFVQYATSAEDDAEVRWLSAALLRSPADPRWTELSQAQDGILRRLGLAMSKSTSSPSVSPVK